jgi:hypothetical protein
VTETINENFSVDSTVGRNFIFRIDYTQKNYLRSFSLKSPSGTVYTQLVYDDVAKVAMFKLAEAEVNTLKSCHAQKEIKLIHKFQGGKMVFYFDGDQLHC